MGISRWGKHLEQKLDLASRRPMHPPSTAQPGNLHNEGDKWWTYTGHTWVPTTPTEQELAQHRVDRVVEELGWMDAVAKQLKRSLDNVLGGNRYVGSRFKVSVTSDLQRMSHSVTVAYREVTVGFEVWDEVLANNTTSVAAFNTWIRNLGTGIKEAFLGWRDPQVKTSPNGWYETGLTSTFQLSEFNAERFKAACAEAGVEPRIEEEIARQEEEAVLKSIMQTLDERPDL